MNDHDRAVELLPWLVNGRLQGDELAWVNMHLERCAQCRREFTAEQRIRTALISQPTVEFAPQPSFNRLWERIEADAATVLPNANAQANDAPAVNSKSSANRVAWWRAAIAAQLLVAALLGILLWQLRSATSPDYRTVTTSAAPAAGVAFQVVFDDAVTLADVKAILVRAGVSAIAGPTAAGVYTLQPDAQHRSVDADRILSSLRSDPRVRFAELSGS